MTQSDSAPGTTALETPLTATFYAAVGIPQGIIADPANGETAGAVRKGGELVSLDPAEYSLWVLLLAPMTSGDALAAAASYGLEDPESVLIGLQSRDLLVTIRPGGALGRKLARLRPLPLGVGLGNLDGDHTNFEIQNSSLSLSSPVSVDPAGMMLWWEFDGTASLRQVVRVVSASLPDFSPDLIEVAATRLVHGLMANRLVFLDIAES